LPSTIAQVQREFKDKGLVVLAVSIRERPETVEAWVNKVNMPFPVLLDESGSMQRAWRVTSTPTVFLVDRRGMVVGKAIGTRPWTAPAGRALLAALVTS
jgi:peroxiredoxin